MINQTSGLHVAIIMDGNGRWARKHGKPRWRGHWEGVETVRRVVRAAPDLGINTLTLYAFSSDNWRRPATEVGRLFWLMRDYCRSERAELAGQGVRLTAIGRRDRIPESALRELELTEQTLPSRQRLHLRLAIDYSARFAITQALQAAVNRVQAGDLKQAHITPETLSEAIADGIPDPDLLIRTAGEKRLSDFLLWELAYSEFYFTETYWPEFTANELAQAVSEFRSRERRFGGLRDGRRTA
ncbi:MAG: di-trans,poly-cis-decaprenylcistransferase [Gemmatimonadetes bacterium]|nr:di-trans,poly-cis-decaprenylcistransferase [Gemmatimonadota bacterium]